MPRARKLLVLVLAAAVLPIAGGSAAPVPAQQGADPPQIASAVGLSRTRVRIRFASPIAPARVAPGDITLTMGGEARTVSGVHVAPDGETAELEARPAWPYGTAGTIRMRGGNPVRVWAAPGDVTPPVLRDVRLVRRIVCIVGVSRSCSASGGTVAYRVDEAVTIVLDLRRRSTDAPSLMKVLRGEGRGTVRFREKIEGRRLRPGAFRLTVTAIDAAGNESRPVTLTLRVRR